MSAPKPPVLLESGDHLSREEFHRRYCQRPDIKKAELIEGVVYVASPMRIRVHDKPNSTIAAWLAVYASHATGIEPGGGGTIYLDADTEVQPDGYLYRVPPPGPDAARIRDDDYLEGAPQLIVEVAASSASIDLHTKRRAYERAGVQEYIVWRTIDEAVDWFRLRGGTYQRVEPDARGVIESAAFRGLRLNVPKLLAGDVAGVLAELDAPSAH